ncbi:MAG TPA: GreA/GreB family elongation factor [Candidatus Limnocylindria bacterium]|nr:GreA/GreB family elongation factor [Candidatus Limnocylindria bacterium]
MTLRDELPPILRGEEPTALDPETRHRLDDLAHRAHAEGQVVYVRDECAARLRQPGASSSVEYLLAAACALNGELERAHQTLLALGERLVAAAAWEPLAAVAETALALNETHAAAHLLVRAHEGLGRDPERIEALERAWALMPDDLELGLLLAVRLDEAGQGEHRRELLAELLPRFAEERRYAGLEEAALEFAEHGDAEALVNLIDTLPRLAEHEAFTESQQLIAIALPVIAERGRAGDGYAALRAVATRAILALGAAGGEPFRAPLLIALAAGPGQALPDAKAVLAASGLSDPLKPLLPALERFDQIAALPPGRAVLHGSFGPGRVVSDDGEVVVIDFARSRGHRMPYPAARRSLTPIAEDDLRLLHLTDPGELQRLRAEAPGEMLVRALRALGGAADAQKLKVFLVGANLVPSGEWTAFYRRVRAAAEQDARVDSARAFEQHYRLAPERAQGSVEPPLPLPPLAPGKPVRTNLATLRKFLTQHPTAEATVEQRFGKFVERALLDEEGVLADRARAGLYFSRWFPARMEEWRSALRELWERGLAISDLSGEREQRDLLDASHAAGVEADALLSALDSRFSSVREAAERYREALDESGRDDMRRTLVEHAARYPAAAIRMLERELAMPPPHPNGWRLLWAALAVIEDRPKPSVAEKVLAWLEPQGAFDRHLANVPCPERLVLKFTVLLRQWRSSDRYLFPALDAARRFGLGEAVDTVHGAREQRTAKLFSQVGQQGDIDIPVMTRATWKRLKSELERLQRELRTTIPATIQKARELGDLKENAEYHSAKLKQANVSKQVASLQLRLGRARFVEDAELEEGVVGLGTEVVLESDDALTTYWILGEGEQHHGDHVVSFQAPVGRALMGKSIGDTVELDHEGAPRRYRVVSIERKLPPADREESLPSA